MSDNETPEFFVNCECGLAIGVRKSQAGGTASCKCGRVVSVPSLANLRRNAGLVGVKSAVEKNIEELLESGELPVDHCVECKGQALEELKLLAVCESSHLSSSSSGSGDGLQFLFALLIGLTAVLPKREDVVHGRDTIVDAPIPICPRCKPIWASPIWPPLFLWLRRLGLAGLVLWVAWDWRAYYLYLPALVLTMLIATICESLHQKVLRRLVTKTPIYAELLERFPETKMEWR
ncbi:MAG: hypothetical protein AAF483_20620 [Planctomycetota bacterium]